MKRLIAYTTALMFTLTILAQAPADSVKVYFRMGHSRFDSALGTNRSSIDRFTGEVRQAIEAGNLDRIEVRGYASPDGDNAANIRLSRSRCNTIIDILKARTGVTDNYITSQPEGIAWKELRKMVSENSHVPYREKVLDILDNTPVWVFDADGKVVSGRKKQLMDLAGGVPYRWMFEHLFPELRNAVAISLFLKNEQTTAKQPDAAEQISEAADTAISVAPADTLLTPEIQAQSSSIDQTEVAEEFAAPADSHIPRHRFALKTNLLYDAALMPNLELEWLVNDNWSIALEGNVAWWSKQSDNKCYQIAMISPEVRRWIRQRAPWHGMYAGVFVGGGKYDLQNGRGYHGEGGFGGLSFGYMWPVSRCISFEAGIGVGYLYTQYKEYVPRDGHYLYQHTKNLHYFGPLKLKFSFVWRFYDINKTKKTCSVL